MGDETVHDENGPPAGGEEAAALKVITAFGGIRPMATKLDVPVSTVQGWKARGVIPEARHSDIREAAARHGVEIDPATLAASAEAPEDGPEEGPGEGTEGTAEAAASNGSSESAEPAAAEGQEPPAPPPPAPPPQRRGGWFAGFLVGALVLAVGAAGAVLTRDQWDPRPEGSSAPDDALAGTLADLGDKVAKLEAQIADFAKRETGSVTQSLEGLASKKELTALSETVTKLQDEIASPGKLAEELDAKIKAIESRVASLDATAKSDAAAATDVDGLKSALAKLEGQYGQLKTELAKLDNETSKLLADQKTAQQAAAKEAALWAAVGRLRDSLRSSAAFEPELATVRKLASGTPGLAEALAPLEKGAAGVPSLASLQRSFPATARAIIAASHSDDSEGMLGDVWSRVSEVVTVRRLDEATAADDHSASAVVTRAEGRLEAGDLAAAVQALEGLQGEKTKQAAAGWLAEAKSRLAIDAAIGKLDGLLAGRLTTGG